MKFILEVDVSKLPDDSDAGKELGRILRFWAGAFKDMELKPGAGSALYDSGYREVGYWTLTEPESGS